MGIGWRGCPWPGLVERVGGLLVLFLPLSPSLEEIICISSWFWAITYCRISTVPVSIGCVVSSSGAVLTMFAWCGNFGKGGSRYFQQYALAHIQLLWGSILQYWWVLDEPHKNVSWTLSPFSGLEGGNSRTWWTLRKFLVLLRILYALEIAHGYE